jgi:ribulose-phosphate 3-epimerase
MPPLIVPAIISRSQNELDVMLERLKDKAKRIMLDVMDGIFVQSRSLDFDFKLPDGFEFEVHMMTVNPIKRIQPIAKKVDIAILHVETLQDIEISIEQIKKLGLELTLALNPDTGVGVIEPYLNEIDGVLVMTVTPGKYGSVFLSENLEKVKRIRELDTDLPIEVDGGMNPENAFLALEAGADVIVSGSYILKSDDVERAMWELTQFSEKSKRRPSKRSNN